MRQYKRPEKELDPAKAPGQIVNRVPSLEYKPVHGGYPGKVVVKCQHGFTGPCTYCTPLFFIHRGY